MSGHQGFSVRVWRLYDRPIPPGFHVLAERLWPRGVRKSDLPLEHWAKELAPSSALRAWFGHDPKRWMEFRARYLDELREHRDAARDLLGRAGGRSVILLYAARDEQHNGALVLAEFLMSIARNERGGTEGREPRRP